MTDWIRGLAAGQWYEKDGEPFEVVAVDVDNETVLVQHFDGTLEDYDFESWMELRARPIPEPEDYSGALDLDRIDAIPDDDLAMRPSRWNDPLDFLDSRF